MPDPVKFAVGGPVQVKEGTYLARAADRDLLEACQAGEFAYVLASRQIGKTSLMFETARKLRDQGYRTALLDLSSIGQKYVEAASWYFSLIGELARQLGLEIEVQSWWDKRPPLSSLPQRFLEFLREVVLAQIKEPIVVFIDEIDVTLGLDFTDDFFAAIRLVYNERAHCPDYRRLSFVLLGVATPDELIKDNSRTPFNIGRAIPLADFTSAECDRFRQAIESKYAGRHYFERIYDWTAGQPYLTQKLGEAVLKEAEAGPPGLVEKLVAELFLNHGHRHDDNLHFIESRVSGDQQARELLALYKRILQAEEAVADDEKSTIIHRLKLYGLVVAPNGRLKVRNKLYARAFDVTWVHEMLERSTRLTLGLPRRYEILQEIGRGGFATIYLARTTLESGETKNVALKVLNLRENLEPDTPKLIQRFEREAAAITRLDHPNIIRIHEAGRSQTSWGSTLFIAMEYIAGGTLQKKLKTEGSLRRDEAIMIVKQIGAALGFAHQQGIIHRDIKPGNILLNTAAGPENVRPVLTDFGLVKELSGDDDSPSSGPVGTVRYMTPEQLAPDRWKQVRPSPATDIYALAITFYEMLVGRHPYEADSDHKLTEAELAEKHLNEPLPALDKMLPEAGSFFDEALRKATAKNPAERYEHVVEFIEALEAANEAANRSRAARLVEVARDYVLDGDLDAGQDMIERALEFSAGYVEALRLRGKIKAEQGQLQAALEDYRQAYEQEGNPASAAGLDYLAILKEAAAAAWQQAAYPQAIRHYSAIKQELNEERASAAAAQPWAEAWQALVAAHHQAGLEVYAAGRLENIDELIAGLQREIAALTGLGAEPECEDLQKKVRWLQVQHHQDVAHRAYAGGQPADVLAAIHILRGEIRALEALEAVRESRLLREELRGLRVRCHYLAGSRAYTAGRPDHLAEAIRILGRKIRQLKRLGADHEAGALQENLKACHHQAGIQAYAEGCPEDMAMAMAILGHEIEALAGLQAEPERQDLQAKQRDLQIKAQFEQGQRAYAGGRPTNLPEAIGVLKEKIGQLKALAAEAESRDLEQKLKQLHITKYKHIIETASLAISNKDDTETTFYQYDQIDQAYQALLELEPGQPQWSEQKRARLKEQAEYRQKFAQSAEVMYQYEVALRHYEAIQDIEQSQRYPGLAQSLQLDLAAKIADLKEMVAFDLKYQAIESLIDQREYAEALNQLAKDFIGKGNYGHRDVARLLWGLTYAKQHDWQFPPPAWQHESELRALRDELRQRRQELEQARARSVPAQNETTEPEPDQRDKLYIEWQKLERRRRSARLSYAFIVPSLVIGGVMGMLVGIIAPDQPPLAWLAAVAIVALLALIGLQIVMERRES